MANNLAQKEMREKQSPKGNVLKNMAYGAKKMMTDTGWMKKGLETMKAMNPVAMTVGKIAKKGIKVVGRKVLDQVDKDIEFKRKAATGTLKADKK
jgi:hypothetical protein